MNLGISLMMLQFSPVLVVIGLVTLLYLETHKKWRKAMKSLINNICKLGGAHVVSWWQYHPKQIEDAI